MRTFKPYPLHWVVESLFDEPSYEEKAMFGCRACYLHGQMKLVLASQSEEPWKGLLIPTDRESHPALLGEFSDLIVHPVLGKWLYLPEDQEDFESLAERVVMLVLRNDVRIGIDPKPRKAKKRKVKKKASAKATKNVAKRKSR